MAKSGPKIAVHIIESPRDSDRQDRRFEGAALAEAMTLFRIPYTVHDVRTKASFEAAFEDIIDWHVQHRRPRRIPVIHLSAHGDRKGLELTSGDDILWSTVAQCVGKVASKCDEAPAVDVMNRAARRTFAVAFKQAGLGHTPSKVTPVRAVVRPSLISAARSCPPSALVFRQSNLGEHVDGPCPIAGGPSSGNVSCRSNFARRRSRATVEV